MIDLKPFCSTDKDRPDLMEPLSLGDWTYASDGRILVRVARRNDVPPRGGKPLRKRLAALVEKLEWRWADPYAHLAPIPDPHVIIHVPEKKCSHCEGEDCSVCDGSGVVIEEKYIARFADQDLNIYYLDLIRALPGVALAFGKNANEPAVFSFESGVGCLMPMSTRDIPAEQAA